MHIKSERQKILIRILVILTLFIVGTALILPSEAEASSRPSRPKPIWNLTVNAVGTNSIQIRFRNVSKAKGYQIYQATTRNGKYKKVKTLKQKQAKNLIYTRKKLKAGKRYYYKVRAYKTYRRGKKTRYVYGKYSAKKSAATKQKPSDRSRKPGSQKPVQQRNISPVGDFDGLRNEIRFYRQKALRRFDNYGYWKVKDGFYQCLDVHQMDFGSTENRGIFLQVLKGPVTRYFDPLTWTSKTKDCAVYYSCATTITEQGTTSTPLVRPSAENRARLEAGQPIKRDNYKSGDTQGLGTGHGFACGRSRAIPDLYVIGYQNGKCVFVYLECWVSQQDSLSWI